MSPLLRLGVLLCLLFGALPPASADEVVLAASSDSPALRRFVAALAARRPDDRVRFVAASQLGSPSTLPADCRLILFGTEALDWRLSDPGGPPTLVLQVNRVQAFQRLQGHARRHLTLLWNDPQPQRQLHLIRQLLPQARRVGVLYGEHSRFLADELLPLAAAEGLELHARAWPDTADSRPLNRLLDESDVLLGIDDPTLFNPQTIKTVLLASYGRKQALIGPTAAFIRAGSLISSYSDSQNWLATLDRLLSQPPQKWPAAAYPHEFKVLSNPQVGRSLGIELSDDAEQARQLRQWENAK